MTEPDVYFYSLDVHDIPFLLSFGIPEYIVPAVPCHAAAYMVVDLLKLPLQCILSRAEKQEPGTEYSGKLTQAPGLKEEGHADESPESESTVMERLADESPTSERLVSELFIGPDNAELLAFFKKTAAVFPEDVIAGRYPEHGMLFFSYAREGEICPDGCPGPKDRCPTFGRIKPKTITEYALGLSGTLPGWVFESEQMKPGIGGIRGTELK